MKFFSGFCFDGESELFSEYIGYSDFCVAGFSYGAVKAFEYTSTCRARIDKLQLFSPAFFQNKSDKFKRLQTLGFGKDPDRYIQNFLNQVKYPTTLDIVKYKKDGTKEELQELLNYVWDSEKIQNLTKKNIDIEIYLGEKDKIIDADVVLDFFKPYASVYYIKDAGHLL